MNYSSYSRDFPLTDQDLERLEQTVIEAARRQLVGRRFIELYGPLGRGVQSIFNDIFMEKYEAKMDFQGSFDPEIEISKRVNYTIPMLYKDFVLYWLDLEQAKVLDIPGLMNVGRLTYLIEVGTK
ncbi:encapsulin [Bacillus sp. EB600]|uniref:encapsulin n=1 Tax=Bacillus sp. EB600 TaxID=2806345 RepID=UPI002108CFCD|nr:family 1 encapsulin nanocompartment shell protein [Bacillus sp. EB600]